MVDVGDFGAPKADMKDKTMQGNLAQAAHAGPAWFYVSPLERPMLDVAPQSCRGPKRSLMFGCYGG